MTSIRKSNMSNGQIRPAATYTTIGLQANESSDEGYSQNESAGSLEDLALSTSSGSPGPGSSQQSDQFDGERKTNLIVNYLPQGMDLEMFRQLFGSKGAIESIKLVRDKDTNQSMGFGFVNFVSEESAARALKELNGLHVQNKTIKVSLARRRSETIKGANLYVSGIPKRWAERELIEYFSKWGEVITARILLDNTSGLSKGTGFVRFDQKCQAELAIAKLDKQIPPGFSEPIQVKYANNPSAASTASQAAAAAASAAIAGSPMLGGRFNFGLGTTYPAVAAAYNIPALAAFMQTGGLAGTSGLGLNPFGLLTGQSAMPAPTLTGTASTSHRSRVSPSGPIHHQAPRNMRYSPMGTPADAMSAGVMSMSNFGLGSYGLSGNGTQGRDGSTTVFVYNLPPETQETDLFPLFMPFGRPQNVKVVRDQGTQQCKGYAFVVMQDFDGAMNAIANLNGMMFCNRVLQVSFKKASRNG